MKLFENIWRYFETISKLSAESFLPAEDRKQTLLLTPHHERTPRAQRRSQPHWFLLLRVRATGLKPLGALGGRRNGVKSTVFNAAGVQKLHLCSEEVEGKGEKP